MNTFVLSAVLMTVASIHGLAFAGPTPAVSTGIVLCVNLTSSSAKAQVTLEDATTWAEGYVSAQHQDSSDWVDSVEAFMTRKQREKFMFAYCKKYPQNRVVDAAQELVMVFESDKTWRPKNL